MLNRGSLAPPGDDGPPAHVPRTRTAEEGLLANYLFLVPVRPAARWESIGSVLKTASEPLKQCPAYRPTVRPTSSIAHEPGRGLGKADWLEQWRVPELPRGGGVRVPGDLGQKSMVKP
jgi:hypothetical protein